MLKVFFIEIGFLCLDIFEQKTIITTSLIDASQKHFFVKSVKITHKSKKMKSLKAKLQLPKPNLDKRERDEKLAERLQKKLADPKSPSNSPMVKKLKV